ncbi:uncharacterized protein TRIADDRAFT_58322 [Trichoplax adhaerens]|uniref:ubiquitinyl hydrolase 1 n=1 Tax=Trichoplax adhaerens TaxID=10228 RepID=B3S1K4_TRIAD|nr:hypothetical protein TRIADDRAFT_58322 [Trichoplax adhaerens]EDV23557.1 hypothetical protein TRIADDRAFT_58322 [Trichoplax adhaerens]|eukprot:XP_002114467.1 hypothetical protein TRIADDRAFT_58322 [Trichoplax adhaerens]
MGLKESKQFYFNWEEATKRVNEADLKRIKSAFKRSGGSSGFISKSSFMRDVLGDAVPSNIAELMYIAFGGTSKGIHFKDLLSGLLVITQGSHEERTKFIFNAFNTDGGSSISKYYLENTIKACDSHVPDSMFRNFSHGDRITFDQFYQWISLNPKAIQLSSWLLYDNSKITLTDTSATPTFYQSVASITHFTEKDVMELEKKYWALKNCSKSGKFDLETFSRFVCPPLPESLTKGLFTAFDENDDGHIDFKEMVCGLSSLCRGPHNEKRKFCFQIFDVDHDDLLSKSELCDMALVLLEIRERSASPNPKPVDSLRETAKSMVTEILHHYDSDEDDCITIEEFHLWMITSQYTKELQSLLQQVGHIVLGVLPLTREKEKQVIVGWLDRANRHGFKSNDIWYLVSMSWWRNWLEYVGASKQSNHTKALSSSKLSMPPLNRNGNPANNRPLSKSHSSQTFNQRPVNLNGILPAPGLIDNLCLVESPNRRIPTLTNEGGRLKKNVNLIPRRDYQLLPEAVFKALCQWYGCNLSLPRHVTTNKDGKAELELYPICVKILRHTSPNRNSNSSSLWSTVTGFSGITFGGFGGFGVASVNTNESIPRKYLAYTACYSRKNTLKQVLEFLGARLRMKVEDLRLWNYSNEDYPQLLEDEQATIEELKLEDGQQVLIEVRNIDMTWPEEMYQLAKRGKEKDMRIVAKTEKGVTGLSNMGNTCFMNSALQCVSNTQALTKYFVKQAHLHEINRVNPLGMKGIIAKRYGELIQELWSGNTRSFVPLKMRLTICKYAPRFNGFQQQDSQELLSFLLDGLHEDLNRVHDKPYVELKDSDGRSDEEVALEAWENHIKRNKSIVVDLFHGQLRSAVACKTCDHASVTFDPFTFLSLPLPMDNSIFIEVTVVNMDGSTHTKYGLCLNSEGRYYDVKVALMDYTQLEPSQMLLVELFGAQVKNFVLDTEKIRSGFMGLLYIYEIDLPVDESFSSSPTVVEVVEASSPEATNEIDNKSTNEIDDKSTNDITDVDSEEATSSSCKNELIPTADDPLSSNDSDHDVTKISKDRGIIFDCTSSSPSIDDSSGHEAIKFPHGNYVVAMNRKMMRMDVYYLAWQSQLPGLFGVPVIISCQPNTLNSDLYAFVWVQVQRLVTPVERNGGSSRRFCHGCKLECNDEKFNYKSGYLAIDWDPTALHLRYQSSQEKPICHESVEISRQQLSQPIDLDKCLRAFTSEEELGEDESWYCSKCKQHRVATKKLEIWKLPPILIVHMKRFQFVAGRWIKSQKNVKFPLMNMDPYKYVVGHDDSYKATFASSEIISLADSHNPNANTEKLTSEEHNNEDTMHNSHGSGSDANVESPSTSDANLDSNEILEVSETITSDNEQSVDNNDLRNEVKDNVKENDDKEKDSECNDTNHIKADDAAEISVEGATSGIEKRPLYNLYAIASHSGILGGGHYVSFAKNPNNKWYIFNDSSCKETTPERVSEESPYLLFYEREDLLCDKVIPDFSEKEAVVFPDEEDDVDAEVKKICTIQ